MAHAVSLHPAALYVDDDSRSLQLAVASVPIMQLLVGMETDLSCFGAEVLSFKYHTSACLALIVL